MTDDDDRNDRILTYLNVEFGDGPDMKSLSRFGRKKKQAPKAILPSAKEMLVALALDRAVDDHTHQKIADGKFRAIVVNVPDAGWTHPIASALEEIIEDQVRTIIRDKVPAPRDIEHQHLPGWAHAGECIVGVAPDVDRALPPLLLSIAELRIDVQPPDAEMVAEVLKHCHKGKVPAEALTLKPQVLTFDELCSLIPQGGKASEAVIRLKAAIERKFKTGGRKRKGLPRLEDAVEFGAARDWAMSLRDDIADLRANLIDWDEIDRGAVFHGPPGTGKTLLAQMLGEAVGIPTVVSSVGELFASSPGYLDSVVKAMRKVFDEAKSKAPCILFLDELNGLPNIDKLDGRNRDWWTPVILDFYTLLDGAMSGRDGVIVIGATNRLDDIHPAILRPGRLERAIYIGPPNQEGVERVMRHHLGDDLIGEDLGMLTALNVARQATGAIIEEQIRAARRTARRAKRPLILEDVHGQLAGEDNRSADVLHRSATHEAGHAVVGTVLGTGTLKSVTLYRTPDSGGSCHFEDSSGTLLTRDGFERMVMRLLAGRAAEEVVLGEASQGAGGSEDSDLGLATGLVSAMHASVGLGDSLVYRAAPSDAPVLLRDPCFRQQIDQTLKGLYARTLELIGSHRENLEYVTGALLEKRFLTGEQVKAVMVPKNESVEPDTSHRFAKTG